MIAWLKEKSKNDSEWTPENKLFIIYLKKRMAKISLLFTSWYGRVVALFSGFVMDK